METEMSVNPMHPKQSAVARLQLVCREGPEASQDARGQEPRRSTDREGERKLQTRAIHEGDVGGQEHGESTSGSGTKSPG